MNYLSILKQSFAIVKKNKVFWVFGLIISAFTGGSSLNFNGNYGNLFKNLDKKQLNLPSNTTDKVNEVLGTATTDPLKFFTSIISTIPVSFWIMLGLGIVVALIFGLLLRIFILNWSQGAILALGQEAVKGNNDLTLKKGSDLGRIYWLRLFLSGLILWAGWLVAFIFGFFLIILAVLIPSVVLKIVFGFLAGLFFLALFLSIIFLIVWSTYCNLTIVLKNFPLKKALSYSFLLAKKYFFDAFLMGLFNTGTGCLFSCLFGCVTTLIFGLLIGIGVALFLINQTTGIIFSIFVLFLFLLLIFFSLLLQGILKSVTITNWVIFFNELEKKTDFPKFLGDAS